MPIDPAPPPRDAPPSGAAVTRPDRRRPGRLPLDNPHLISLLRAPLPDPPPPEHREEDAPPDPADDLAPARGILFGAVLGGLAWSAAIAVILLATEGFQRFRP